MTEFQGVYAAAITPRNSQGEVDFGATFELVDFLCKAGLRGIVLFGAAGEYSAFSIEERKRLVFLAAKRSRVPLLVGVGSATLEASVDLARGARDAAAAAVLLPAPLFFRYGEDDLREYFLQFSTQVSGIPILLSHTPEYTGGIALEIARELLATGVIAGIQDASDGLDLFSALPAPSVLVSNDALIAKVRPAAIVSNSACAIPELVLALHEAADPSDAILQQFVAWTNRFPLPVVIKATLEVRGLEVGPLAVPLSASRREELGTFREWFRESLPALGAKASHG